MLARKYRPATFAELKGQDVLVRTLTNALSTGRVAHAFMLTGVRGVGKTTTARIVARALNCIGPDGAGGPTPTPCGVCANCVAIAADRHVDVIEMDAASRTGIDDIREIIEGVRYAPASARYKVYIIDEVHMLSRQAFNGLLKTLEEPPPHVKFLFATTEVRRVPVTVLSRCQRFDLRRVDSQTLIAHYRFVCEAEGVAIEEPALAMIARAADGSVRDGLSLLDQAMAQYPGEEAISAAQIGAMLGLADRARTIDLLRAALAGEAGAALAVLDGLHADGADPALILNDLLDGCHGVTRLIAMPGSDVGDLTEVLTTLAEKLSLPVISRAWQLLLKGVGELAQAPDPRRALDMIVLRLVYASDLPDPGALVRQITEAGGVTPAPPTRPALGRSDGATALADPAPEADDAALPIADPQDFEQVVALFQEQREGLIAAHLRTLVRLVGFRPGRLELLPLADCPADLGPRVARLLGTWTGRQWMVVMSCDGAAAPTLAEQDRAARDALFRSAAEDPRIKDILAALPGASITDVRETALPDAAGDHPVDPTDDDTEDEDS